jgi:hypothetical protein
MESRSRTSIPEVAILLGLALLVLLATSAKSLPRPTREATWPAAIEVRTYVDLARVEAVRLRRPCRFELDAERRHLAVLDGRGTADAGDDTALYERDIEGDVELFAVDAVPASDGLLVGAAEPLAMTFGPSGLLASTGTGVVLSDGRSARRVTLLDRGTTQVEVWNGNDWAPDR